MAKAKIAEPLVTREQQIVHGFFMLLTSAIVFMGAQILGPIILALFVLAGGVKADNLVNYIEGNNVMRVLLIIIVEALTVWGVYMFMKRRKWTWKTIGLGRKPVWGDLLNGLKAYGIYILIFMVVHQLELLTGLIDTDQAQQLGFDGAAGPALILVLIGLVILPPIAEEVLFRGYMFFGLRKKIPFLASALITSVLFGIAHLEFGTKAPLNWAAAIDTFTLSCVLTYTAEKYKSLWANMVLHGIKNLVAFVFLFLIK